MDLTLGLTDPGSTLSCDLEGPVENVAKLLEPARGAGLPVVLATVAYKESDRVTAASIEKVPALLTLEARTRRAEIDPRLAPRETEPVHMPEVERILTTVNSIDGE